MTPADLRLYGWLLARPSTVASVVAELSGTAEERTLQRVHEDLRVLMTDGKVALEDGGFVWAETRHDRTLTERISDVLRIGPMRLGEITRLLGSTMAEVKTGSASAALTPTSPSCSSMAMTTEKTPDAETPRGG